MRSERPWSTAAHTDTTKQVRKTIDNKDTKLLTLPGFDFGAFDVLEMSRDILNVSFSCLVVPNLAPQNPRLLEVDYILIYALNVDHLTDVNTQKLTLSNDAKISPCSADEGFMAGLTFLVTGARVNGTLLVTIIQWFDATLVVREAALRDVCSSSITLEVDNGNDRSIDRQLLIVGSKTMAVGIRVREKTGLKNGVGRRFNVRNEMGRRKGSLLSEELDILINNTN